jgi:hypothetical protein
MSRREFASKLPTDLACVLHSAKVSPTPFTLRKKAEGPYFEPKIPWLDDYLTTEVPLAPFGFQRVRVSGRLAVLLYHTALL